MAGDLERSGGGMGGGVGPSRRKFLAAGTTAAGAILLNTLSDHTKADEHIHTSNRPTCLAVDTAKNYAYTSNDDGSLIRFRIDDTVEPAQLSDPHTFANPATLKASYVAFGAQRILTSSYDGIVYIYDPDELQRFQPFKQHGTGTDHPQVWVVATSRVDKRAISATNDGKILLWKTDAPDEPATQFPKSGAVSRPIGGLAFVPIGPGESEKAFLSTHGRGDINLWQIDTPNEPLHTFSHGNNHPVNALAITSDGTYFVSGGFDHRVRLWDLKKRKLLKTFKGHDNWVWRVAISPDDKLAVSAGEDSMVYVWDIEHRSDAPKRKFGPYPDGVMGVAFTANNKVIVTADKTKSTNPLRIESL